MKWAQSSEKRWNANWRKSYKRCLLEELICWQLANLLTLSELAAKLSYVSCIHAEVAKYHRNFKQLFLSDATVIPARINYKYLVSLKNDGCNNFCDWYAPTSHDATSTFSLFEMQKHIEDGNSEVYSIRHLSRKLSERSSANGFKA